MLSYVEDVFIISINCTTKVYTIHAFFLKKKFWFSIFRYAKIDATYIDSLNSLGATLNNFWRELVNKMEGNESWVEVCYFASSFVWFLIECNGSVKVIQNG